QYRTVVGMYSRRDNLGSGDPIRQSFRHHIIINTPPEISRPRSSTVAPPSIMVWIWIEVSERVYIPRVYKIFHPLPLRRQKARAVRVRFGIMDINCSMTDVIIA